jgi:hypothetical protein
VTNLNTLLRAHATEVCFHDCQDAAGNDKTLCLIYTPYSGERGEALECYASNFWRAWMALGTPVLGSSSASYSRAT